MLESTEKKFTELEKAKELAKLKLEKAIVEKEMDLLINMVEKAKSLEDLQKIEEILTPDIRERVISKLTTALGDGDGEKLIEACFTANEISFILQNV
jgi:hypothetical protein